MLTFALGPNCFLAIEGQLTKVVVITALGTICFEKNHHIILITGFFLPPHNQSPGRIHIVKCASYI